MNIGIIIQARMGSTRLPGKILKKFDGEKTLLETLLENLHKVSGVKVIVATSVNENNDQLESFLLKKESWYIEVQKVMFSTDSFKQQKFIMLMVL